MAEFDLKKEYAGMPLWLLVALGGAALYLLVQVYKKRQMANQQAATAATASANPAATATNSSQPGNIFFLPNGAQPSQVGVNFNSRPTQSSYQKIAKQYTTTSDMYAAQIGLAVYPTNPNDQASTAVDAEEIIQANPQLDWTRAIPKGTTVNIPVGVGTQG